MTKESSDLAAKLCVMGNRSVLITGGGQGIGRAFAERFARDGDRVAIADINSDATERVAATIRASGGTALSVGTDVSDRGSVDAMTARVNAEYGRIDVLINCAVVKASARYQFWEIPEAEWDRLMAVNVKGVWHAICSVVPTMRQIGGGTIVNLSSAVVNAAGPGFLHYVTSKAAIIGMTRSMARELGEYNIRVNSILPGYVETDAERSHERPDAAVLARRLETQIIKRPANTNDVVGVGLFLASDLSGYMTGQSINIDGGRTFI